MPTVDSVMMALLRILFVFICWGSPLYAVESYEEVLRIARDTDEPSSGAVVTWVTPGSLGERFGLEVGDYIVRFNEQLYLGWGQPKLEGERTLHFVKKGGKMVSKSLPPGLVGFNYLLIYRPELAFLRGEIGVASPKWDRDVVTALLLLSREPKQAANHWQAAKDAGYPQSDPFHDFAEALIKWSNGKGFDADHVLTGIIEKHKTIPDGYYIGVLRLARASNRPDTLLRIQESNPLNSPYSEKFIEHRIELQGQNSNHELSLLEKAVQSRKRNITKEIEAKTGSRGSTVPLLDLINNKRAKLSLSLRVLPRVPTKNLHVRLRFKAERIGDYRDTTMQLVLSDPDFVRDENNRSRNSSFIKAWLQRMKGTEQLGMVIDTSGENFARTYPVPREVRIPMVVEKSRNRISFLRDRTPILPFPVPVLASTYEPSEIMIDLIKLNDEAAFFLNGICQFHMPVKDTNKSVELGIFQNRTTMKIDHLEVWDLID